MKLIFTIFIKETRTYLKSPWFFHVIALATAISAGIFFILAGQFQVISLGVMKAGQAMETFHGAVMFRYISSSVHFCVFLFLPALTARLIAEEKKVRSFDLLMTAPVTSTQIVVAKILAGMFVLFSILALSAIFPLYIAAVAPFDWNLFLTTYVAMFLVGTCYVVIGVFASSISESMIVATILAVVLNFGLWLVALLGQNTDDAVVQAVVNHISIGYHFGNMMKGRVELAGFAFLLSVIGFFGFLAQRAVESMRWR